MAHVDRPLKAAALLGFALAGFFDGILLHQVLEWHHLLSLVPGVERQILWDGLFHTLMYLLALAGLLRLWRWRSLLPAIAGRRLVGAALIGFGGWHMLDVVLNHWVIGLHRTRLDGPDPLLWDFVWLAVFGLGALLLGRRLLGGRGGRGGRGRSMALGLAATVMLAGAQAAAPLPGQRAVVVLFATPAGAFAAAGSGLGRLIWVDGATGVAAMELSEPADSSRLYRHGAILVAPAAATGCLGWSRIAA